MLKLKHIITLLCFIGTTTFVNAQLKIGASLPNLTLKNDKDVSVTLSSFKGKVLLVDFWASWCAPCRTANKNLVKLYDKNKASQFEIVSISIDTKTDKWKKAIQKDKMKHTQLIDPVGGFDAKSAVSFGVESLPAAYLFDASGKLVSINPTDNEIISLIKKNKK